MPQRRHKMMKWKHKWKRRKQQQQEQRVKMLKREQKKSKERAKESQWATVWWRTQKPCRLSPQRVQKWQVKNILSEAQWTMMLATRRRQMKLVRDIVDVLYSAQWMKMRTSSRSTMILSDAIMTTAWKKAKNQEEPSGSESTSTEATSIVAVVIARESGDEHSDRNTTKLEADRIKGEGLHAGFPPRGR